MSFRFQQFTIRHDQCAMKVGTDGVLLGAWGDVEGQRVLDIGTGSGLIALMAAQRNPAARVVGIDIEETAVGQARQNVAESPFAARVEIRSEDVLTFKTEAPFWSILCNPPFFTEDTLPGDTGRLLARHSQVLPFGELAASAARLLAPGGTFSVILPSQTAPEFIAHCMARGLNLKRRCLVRTVERKPPRRTLMSFTHNPVTQTQEEALCLMAPDGSRSPAYVQLTKEFYLGV